MAGVPTSLASRSRPGAPERIAVGLGAAQVLLAVAALVTILATSETSDPAWEIRRELAPLDLALGVLYAPLGAMIVARSRHAVGWAFLAIGWGYTITGAAIAWTVLTVAQPHLPGAAWAAPVLITGWTAGALLSILVLPFLLTPDRPRGWARRVALASLVLVGFASGLRLLIQLPGAPRHPLTGGGRVSEIALAVDGSLIPIYAMLAVAVALAVAFRRRRARPDQRRGLAWLLAAQVTVAVSYLVFEVGVSLEGRWLLIGTALLVLAEIMLLASVFVLIRRQPAWRVDLAISRTLVGLLLTVTLVIAYVVAVWALGMVAPWGAESSRMLAVAGLALGVLPLRDWLQRQVERLVFGSGADPWVLLERVAQALASGSEDQPQLAGLIDALCRALRLGGAQVSIRGVAVASSGRLDPDDPEDADRALRLDLHQQGHPIGMLRVVPPRGERLDPRTVRLLRQIAGLVAVSAGLEEANRAVEEARTRVVEVREQERRLLRRELHDGIGPALSGTALALAAVPVTSSLSPDDAVLLRRLVEELSRRADDVRQMARVLLPPVLDEGRLGDALTLLAERHSMPRLAIKVDAPDADRLDGPRQVVTYQVAAEALRNAVRHAGARHCLVRLTHLPDGSVALVVRDDGRGIDPDAAPGIGLTSMQERAAELDGTVTVASDESGTRVEMVLP